MRSVRSHCVLSSYKLGLIAEGACKKLSKLLEVRTELRISKATHEVFDAIVEPQGMSNYFVTTGSGRMDSGRTVHWTFADVGGELDVKVKKVVKDRSISYLWSAGGVETTVKLNLEPEGEATVVKVNEKGWSLDDKGIERLAEQTQGWVHFLLCLKAFLEYGINLGRGGTIGEKHRHGSPV